VAQGDIRREKRKAKVGKLADYPEICSASGNNDSKSLSTPDFLAQRPSELSMSIDRLSLSLTSLTTDTYRSYLVRLWRSNPRSPLRASVQCVQTGALIHFADLPSLFVFLASLDTFPAADKPTKP
jgi:hypothetical protein